MSDKLYSTSFGINRKGDTEEKEDGKIHHVASVINCEETGDKLGFIQTECGKYGLSRLSRVLFATDNH